MNEFELDTFDTVEITVDNNIKHKGFLYKNSFSRMCLWNNDLSVMYSNVDVIIRNRPIKEHIKGRVKVFPFLGTFKVVLCRLVLTEKFIMDEQLIERNKAIIYRQTVSINKI
jgi:hypothetical protein